MKNYVLALGYFDSIHIGHRYLLEEGKKLAKKYTTQLLPMTFDDGFLSAVGRKEDEVYLLEERKLLFSQIGVKEIFVFPINKEFLSKTKEEFLDYIASFEPKAIILGKDYRFGRDATGGYVDIIDYFKKKNVEIETVNIVKVDGEKVSTSYIRCYLQSGEISKANELLKTPFFYSGIVIDGRKKGREIGFPTINLDIPKFKIKIKRGVYQTKLIYDGREYLSITNVGEHPTFQSNIFNIETHILDFEDNIYGKNVRVEFHEYLREIINFENENELKAQLQKDISLVRKNK